MLQGLIFDFDGLILDTETPLCEAWADVCGTFGLDLPRETWLSYIGSRNAFNRYEDLEARLGTPIDKEAVQRDFRSRTRTLLESEKIRPGILDYLTEAKRRRLKLGIASNSDREWVSGHLERLELASYFTAIACGNEVADPKPAPDVYLRALADLAMPSEAAAAVEDSALGVAAAKAAGMFTVAVPNELTSAMDFRRADIVVDTLEALPFASLARHFEDLCG